MQISFENCLLLLMLAVLGYSRQIPNEKETSDLEIDLEISPDFEDIQSQTQNNGTQIPSADGKIVMSEKIEMNRCLLNWF